jgi:actin, other eukaryote
MWANFVQNFVLATADQLSNPPLVHDFGSHMTKSGFAGDDAPRVVFPSLIARPKNTSSFPLLRTSDVRVGDEVYFKGSHSWNITQVLEKSTVKNWDDMEKLFHHTCFNEIRVAPEEHHHLIAEAPFTPLEHRIKMCEIAFEKFDCAALSTASSSLLSCLCTGRTTGLVIDSGYDSTTCVPVFEGDARVLPHAMNEADIAGASVDKHFLKLLAADDCVFTTAAEKDIARDIKEKRCYLLDQANPDFDQEVKKKDEEKRTSRDYNDDQNNVYEMPDGSMITLGSSMFAAPELLFRPHYDGLCDVDKHQPLHQMVAKSLMSTQLHRQRKGKRNEKAVLTPVIDQFAKNIILVGGNSRLKNLDTRLADELRTLVPPAMAPKLKVTCPLEGKYSVWIGGSILASLSKFQGYWMTKAAYDEFGADEIARALQSVSHGYALSVL